MRCARWFILALVALLPVIAACGGGGGDDDADDDGTADESDATQQSNGNDDSDDGDEADEGDEGDDSDADIPQVKAGAYGSGRVRIEVTGDKDLEVDAEGGGIAQEGFGLFTYQNSTATVQLAFSNEEGSPGAVALTTSAIVTGGEWGKDCQVTLEQSDGKVEGEFSCDAIDALEPGTTKIHRVKLKGTFTAGP